MKNITKVFIVLLVPIVVSLAACATKAGALENVTWVLESYGESGNLESVLADTEITATFNSAEERVEGSAGCNNYLGGYELKGSELSIPGPIGATMMSCGDQIDEQERQYLTALESAESYKIEYGELRMTCGNQVLIFKRK